MSGGFVAPIPYEDFNSTINSHAYVPADDTSCSWPDDDWCLGYCLECEVVSPVDSGTYLQTWYANVSVKMSDYGYAENLPFTWTYSPLWCGNDTASGTVASIHSSIGNATFVTDLFSVDFTLFESQRDWGPGSNFTYDDTVSIPLSDDGLHAFIPIIISLVLKSETPYENLLFYVREMTLELFQPPAPSPPPSLPDPISPTTSTDTSSLPSVTMEVSSSSKSTSLPVGAIAAIAVGALLLIALIVVGACFLILLRRRRRQEEPPVNNSNRELNRTPSAQGELQPPGSIRSENRGNNANYMAQNPENASSDLTASFASPVPLSWPHGNVTQREDSRSSALHPSLRPPVTQTVGPKLNHSPISTDESPPNQNKLADWANANRNYISPDVETRLARAGYQPDDDPDILTEEEWTEHGITKFQLIRLREIYARNHLGK